MTSDPAARDSRQHVKATVVSTLRDEFTDANVDTAITIAVRAANALDAAGVLITDDQLDTDGRTS